MFLQQAVESSCRNPIIRGTTIVFLQRSSSRHVVTSQHVGRPLGLTSWLSSRRVVTPHHWGRLSHSWSSLSTVSWCCEATAPACVAPLLLLLLLLWWDRASCQPTCCDKPGCEVPHCASSFSSFPSFLLLLLLLPPLPLFSSPTSPPLLFPIPPYIYLFFSSTS